MVVIGQWLCYVSGIRLFPLMVFIVVLYDLGSANAYTISSMTAMEKPDIIHMQRLCEGGDSHEERLSCS